MAENGEEKLLEVARQIAKTLRQNETITDDFLPIFSNFDGRFSREKFPDLDEDDGDLSGGGGRRCAALDRALDSLDRQISPYLASDNPIWADAADASAFLDSVDELIATLADWRPVASDKSVAASLSRADDLLHQAMFRIEDEFRSLAERGSESFDLARPYADSESDSGEEDEEEDRIPVAQPLDDYDVVIDSLPSGAVNDLHEIAKRMVAAGFGKECCHVYSSCRRDFLEESVSRLGLQRLSIEEVQKMSWQSVEDEIDRWIKASNAALRIFFPSERRLCDRVFFGFSSAADLSFMEVCRGSAIQLLNFADAVAIGSRSPERLFKILDLFEALRDLMPEFESVFSDQYCSVLRNEAFTVWKRLGEAIRGIFMELENLIRRDPAKASVAGGALHPITRYVMNYVRAACRSRQTLEQVFDENVARASSSSLAIQMAWIMELLESNLEAKSKAYKDPALCALFMMNNGRYIVQKVKDSELGSLLGDDWIRKHSGKVRQYHGSYQRNSWNKVLAILKLENGAAAPVKTMKEKLKLFNTDFDSICKAQSSWAIFDDQLREETKIAVAGQLLPAYRNFIGRFQSMPDIGKNAERHVKYSVEDIEARINKLFQGSGNDRRR